MINLTKEQINKELQRYRRKRLLFLVLAIVCFSLWLATDIVTLSLYYSEIINDELYLILSFVGQCIGVAGVMLIFLRTFLFGRRVKILQAVSDGKDIFVMQQDGSTTQYSTSIKETEEIDSIDPQKRNLISQYEELLNKGIISKEDFEKRKEEILK